MQLVFVKVGINVGKGKNTSNQYFPPPFPTLFFKSLNYKSSKTMGSFVKTLTLYSILTHQQQTDFENIVGKGEIAHNEQFLLYSQRFLLNQINEQFLLYPQRFLLNQIIVSSFVHIFDIISLFATELEEH